MREILFRGKQTDNGKWMYGCLMCVNPAAIEEIIVAPETVGQYTGLKDKHGAEIFEGDIVELVHHLGKETGAIRWYEKECAFILFSYHGKDDVRPYPLAHVNEFPECVEVMGNIHDDPELMENMPLGGNE